jgi:hypothetical protein
MTGDGRIRLPAERSWTVTSGARGSLGGETRIFRPYAVVGSSAPSDRKIEPLMAATAKTTNASMGNAL